MKRRIWIAVCLSVSAYTSAFAQGRGSGMRAGDSFKNSRPPAWGGAAEVSGKGTEDDGKGIEAKITCVYTMSNDGFFTQTKKNGEYAARDIKPGEWRVQVEAPNFVTVRQTVTVGEKKTAFSAQLKRDNSPE